MLKVGIFGATSAIAQEVAKCFSNTGAELFLVARSLEKLNAVRDDLKARGANGVATYVADLTDLQLHQTIFDKALSTMGHLDAVLIAHGILPDQQKGESNVSDLLDSYNTNCISVLSLLTILANYFESEKRGCLAVITSVAGDRGRRSNYIYGSAKGAVDLFLQGLRSRMHGAGVSVVTIKPGFVDTPMTAGVPKNFLFATPQRVGDSIFKAMRGRKDTVYVPWYWRPIMSVIKWIPEFFFKRLSSINRVESKPYV